MRGLIMAVGAVVAIAVLLLVGILLSVEFGIAGGEEYEAGPPLTFDSTSAGTNLTVTVDPEVPAVGAAGRCVGRADGRLRESGRGRAL